jgi:hypothetical protein
LHPDHGYKGPAPQRGEKAEASRKRSAGWTRPRN